MYMVYILNFVVIYRYCNVCHTDVQRFPRDPYLLLNLVGFSKTAFFGMGWQSPHFEDGDFPSKFPTEVVLTKPGAQRTKGELDFMMDVSSSFV